MNLQITLKRGFLIFLLGCLFFFDGNAQVPLDFAQGTSSKQTQPPYQVKLKQEIAWLSSGITTLATGFYLSENTQPFNFDEILAIDVRNVNSFDQFASENYSTKIQRISDVFLLSSFGVGIPFLFEKRIRNDAFTIGVIYTEAAAIAAGTTLLAKALTERPRPFVFNPNVSLGEKLERGARHSFFSGHTSVAAMNTFFLAKIFSDYHSESKWKPYVWTSAILIPAATAWARVEGGKHYPTDVIAGYAVGALVGYFVPHFHKIKNQKKLGIHMRPMSFVVSVAVDLK